MKVFLYERVSSEEQVKHGYSLEAQHESLIEFCDRHNHVILGTYKDEHKRSFWHKLLKEVKVNEDGLPVEILYK